MTVFNPLFSFNSTSKIPTLPDFPTSNWSIFKLYFFTSCGVHLKLILCRSNLTLFLNYLI